ncbi:uncharacterized protein MYCFIDRAFT_80909 [Pseudocercospora fijiensis CIRAD86]|uniref:DUF7730 domain-containing protein n=1 Tax=Pseudocercospora fijiensis (strain CIRAD86) TaxID=383855 RepID=M2YL81_PSEFD|nr:uncharacterized protein MYCFIDRAFT_80909 [Pseudocercospora fijiensis CIRAD86]EME78495.1 hypothetical protein MYCFIDRAFT_80909 [Pseudocercospora fijiensis CIRAD86]
MYDGNGQRNGEKRRAAVQACVFLTFGSVFPPKYIASYTRDQIKEHYWRTYDQLSERKRDCQRRRGKAFLDVTKLNPRPQTQSAFLARLPLEIRQMIYVYVFDHIKVSIGQVRHFPKKRLVGIPALARYKLNSRLALPLSCRQLYLECFHMLYISTTFCFMDPGRVRSTKKSLSPSIWDRIKSVEINRDIRWLAGSGVLGAEGRTEMAWNEFWENINSLEGLQEIRSYNGMMLQECQPRPSYQQATSTYGPRYGVKFSHPVEGRVSFTLPSGTVFESKGVDHESYVSYRLTPDQPANVRR